MKMKVPRRMMMAVLLCGVCLCAALAEPGPAYHGPILVDLLAYLNVRHVHPGSSVLVQVVKEWNGMGCTLKQGAILEAKVVSAIPREKGVTPSQLALSFSKTKCSGAEMAPMDLVLAAVAFEGDAYNPSHGQYPVVRYALTKGAGNSTPLQGSISMDAVEFMALSDSKAPPPKLKPGDVWGIRGLTLQIGAGPDRSSLLSEKDRDIYIEHHAQFLLVPAAVAFLATPASLTEEPIGSVAATVHPTPASATPAAPAPVEEFAPCAPPRCTVDLPSAVKEEAGHAATAIAVHALGYAPRLTKEIDDFDDDVGLAWLGPDELLLAFNSHKLIPRSTEPSGDVPVRVIHSVLIDPTSSRVSATADWELSDSGEFLWQLAGNRILAHVRNELRVYGAGLKLESRIPLDGRLAWVRTSPNGEIVAVAVLKERHTQEVHAHLRDILDHEPDEDVDILILDKDFKTVAKGTSASDVLPPTLLNEGQVNLLAQPKMRFRLALQPFEGEPSTLARFSSSCLPTVSSFAPDLLIVRTCSKESSIGEYRILRANGQVVVNGRSDPQELGQEASGNSPSKRFAVRVVHATGTVVRGSVFHGADLDSEEVRVYRAEDGKRLTAIHVNAPAPSRGGYALSPDGTQLAVLAGNSVSLYAVPADAGK
jgi:hypothetical protein